VTFKGAGWSKLAQLMANHIFGDEDWYMLATIVNRNRVTNHGWDNHRTSRPSLDNNFCVLIILIVDLLLKVTVHEWTLF